MMIFLFKLDLGFKITNYLSDYSWLSITCFACIWIKNYFVKLGNSNFPKESADKQ